MVACDDKPASLGDWLLLAGAIAASVPFVAANVVVLCFRRRCRYFGAQGGSSLILASSSCGLLWIASNFVINLHFPRRSFVLQACALWSFWLQLTLGFWLWLACLIVRLYKLHLLCTTTASASDLPAWTVYLPVLWSPSVIFAIIASARHASNLQRIADCTNNCPDCTNCQLNPAWRWSSFLILPPFYFFILVILLFRLKGQKDYMLATEYRHTSEYSLMAFVIYLLHAVAYESGLERKVSGRCFLTFCVCCLVFSHFWVRMGWPVYLCLFKGQSEMESFENQLRGYGTVCLDKTTSVVDSPQVAGRSIIVSSAPLHEGDWILRAIDAAMLEASELKERIDQLEQKKSRLSSKIQELAWTSSAPVFSC